MSDRIEELEINATQDTDHIKELEELLNEVLTYCDDKNLPIDEFETKLKQIKSTYW